MPEDRTLSYGSSLPATWLAALQEFVGMMSGNFSISLASHNSIQIVAGSDAAQASIGIEGLFRYVTTTISAAVTGAAGTYSIFVTTGPNSFTTGTGGSGEIDNTNYAFALNVQPKGSTPSVNGTTITNYRIVGELDWDGTNVTVVRQFFGAGDTTMGLMPTADTTTMIPLLLKAIASQASMLTQWLDVSGVAVAQVPPSQLAAGDSSKNVATTVWFQSQPNIIRPGDLIWSAATSRVGALLCDGAAYSRTAQAALFAAISTTYGVGDGSTTFNVPNYIARSVIGAGTTGGLTTRALGWTGGAETVLLAANESGNNPNGTVRSTGGTGVEDTVHTHAYSGTTGNDAPDHAHVPFSGASFFITASGNVTNDTHSTTAGATNFIEASQFFAPTVTGGATARHTHVFGGTTTGQTANHSHAIVGRAADAAHNNMQPSATANIFIKT